MLEKGYIYTQGLHLFNLKVNHLQKIASDCLLSQMAIFVVKNKTINIIYVSLTVQLFHGLKHRVAVFCSRYRSKHVHSVHQASESREAYVVQIIRSQSIKSMTYLKRYSVVVVFTVYSLILKTKTYLLNNAANKSDGFKNKVVKY